MRTAPSLYLVKLDAREPTRPADALKLYLDSLSPSGRRTMASKVRTVEHLIGRHTIDPTDLHAITLAARGALQDAGAAPATIKATLSALKGIARAAWLLGLIGAEDLQRVKDVKASRGSRLPRGRAHSGREIEALMKACARDLSEAAGARDAATIALQYSLGLRRTECVDLDLDDYSPAAKEIRVKGKGNKERTAYTADKGVTAALGDWLIHRGLKPGPLLCPVDRKGAVIVRRLTAQALYDSLRKRGQQAGVKNISPHNLRRTFATDLLDRGADIAIVSQLLGHANLETTKAYDRRGERANRKAAGLLSLPYEDRRQPALPWGEPKAQKSRGEPPKV